MATDGRFIAYHRVSTAKQGQSGLGLEAQKAAVANYLNGGDWQLLGEFTEVESGKRSDRPQLAAALEACRLTGATLVISKLDRLTRNVAFLANLMESGVSFVACDNPHATKFTIHILAAVAEHEREAIAKRTKDALAAAKARGTKADGSPLKLGGYRGGPKVDGALGGSARRTQADEFAKRVLPTITAIQAEGKSLTQIAETLKTRGICSPNGGKWTATTVRRVLARAA